MTSDFFILLRICAFFGIYLESPKCFRRGGGGGSKGGKYMATVYIIILMSVTVLLSILGTMNNELLNEYIISWVVSTIVYISQMLTHFIIMCEALTKHEQHEDFLRVLYSIEFSFKIRLRMDIEKSKIIKELRWKFIKCVLISQIGILVFAVNIIINSNPGYFWWALTAIIAQRVRMLQLIIYVDLLKYFLLGLNKKLNQVVCLRTERSKQLLDIDYKHLKSMELMKSIKDIYASIYEASMLINEFGQASLFAASASIFLDFTCHIYWTLLALDNLFSSYNITSSIATIVPLGWFLFNFCYSCEIIKQEAYLTSLQVSRLSSLSLCSKLTKTYKSFVHDFSLQIMHQRIEFTGKRFFTFDFHFIFALWALIATHLIILIQFTKSDASHEDLNKTVTEAA